MSVDDADLEARSSRQARKMPRVRGSASATSGKSANFRSMRAMCQAKVSRPRSRAEVKSLDSWYAVSTDRSVPGTGVALLATAGIVGGDVLWRSGLTLDAQNAFSIATQVCPPRAKRDRCWALAMSGNSIVGRC